MGVLWGRDLTDATYDRLTVIGLDHRRGHYRFWRCRCACGKEVVVSQSALTRRKGGTKSCGCFRSDYRREQYTTHGLSETPRWYLWNSAKKRAKMRGLIFELTLADIPEIPTHCPILGFPLQRHELKASFDSPTLDRIRPELGYVPGNLQVISQRANVIKSDATAAEVRRVADYMQDLERLL